MIYFGAAYHDVDASEENEGGQDRVGVLMESGILEVVIVARDEDGKRDTGDAQRDLDCLRPVVRKSGPEHPADRSVCICEKGGLQEIDSQTCGVDHGQFINQLHRICNIC